VCGARGEGRGEKGGPSRGNGSDADAGDQGGRKQEGSALDCGDRGRDRESGRGRKENPSKDRGSHAGVGDQDGRDQEGSSVVCGDIGKATGGRAGAVMGRRVPGGAGDKGVVGTESVVANDSITHGLTDRPKTHNVFAGILLIPTSRPYLWPAQLS